MPHKREGSDLWQIRVRGIRRSSGTKSKEAAAALEHKLNHEAFETAKLGINHQTWDEACLAWIEKHKGTRSIEIQKAWGRYWTPHLRGKKLRTIQVPGCELFVVCGRDAALARASRLALASVRLVHHAAMA